MANPETLSVGGVDLTVFPRDTVYLHREFQHTDELDRDDNTFVRIVFLWGVRPDVDSPAIKSENLLAELLGSAKEQLLKVSQMCQAQSALIDWGLVEYNTQSPQPLLPNGFWLAAHCRRILQVAGFIGDWPAPSPEQVTKIVQGIREFDALNMKGPKINDVKRSQLITGSDLSQPDTNEQIWYVDPEPRFNGLEL